MSEKSVEYMVVPSKSEFTEAEKAFLQRGAQIE